MKKLKEVPKFNSEYLDWSRAKVVTMPNLKKSTKTISLRLPEDMLYN